MIRAATRRVWQTVNEVLALGLLLGVILFALGVLAPGQRTEETRAMQTPSLGRVVLFAFDDPQSTAEVKITERPAEIVRVWEAHGVNLRVSLDGTNDMKLVGVGAPDIDRMAYWATSILPADDQEVPQVGRYRWPPRVK